MKIPWRSNEDLQGLERISRRSWRWDAITRDSLRPFESNLVTNPSSGALLLFWFATNYTTNVTIPSPNTNQRVYDSFTTVVHFSSRHNHIQWQSEYHLYWISAESYIIKPPQNASKYAESFVENGGHFWWIFWPYWSLLNGFDI